MKLWVVSVFLLHIFFVNLMVGGALMTFVNEIIGLRFPRYDRLARYIGETVTVNKSLAVVLGIGPMLMMNRLYTIHFYSANALTGHAWVMLVPLIITVFLLAYLHKYTWETWTGPRKGRHLIVGCAVAALFLFIPLIFLVQVNTMLFPDKWAQVKGFFTALQIDNVFPRYFHFIAASLALMRLSLAFWFGRKSFPIEKNSPSSPGPNCVGISTSGRSGCRACSSHSVRWSFSRCRCRASPRRRCCGFSERPCWRFLCWGYCGGRFTTPMRGSVAGSGPSATLFSLVVLGMGQGRHFYREAALAPHKTAIERKTAEFRSIELATQMRLRTGMGAGDALTAAPSGNKLFTQTCMACHAVEKPTSAPSLLEIAQIYKDNPAGIVTWAKAPGRKRPQYGLMPAFAHLGDDNLALIAAYMLEAGVPALKEAK